eukprot:11447430-Ditylum_brightwellii.AAC.1
MVAGRDECASDALNEYDKILIRLHSVEKQRACLLMQLDYVSCKRNARDYMPKRKVVLGRRKTWWAK